MNKIVDEIYSKEEEEVKYYLKQFFPEATYFKFITNTCFSFIYKDYKCYINRDIEYLWYGKCVSSDNLYKIETKLNNGDLTCCLDELKECLDHMNEYLSQEH